jgi:hypothetical protein
MPGMTVFELAHDAEAKEIRTRAKSFFLTAYYNEDQHRARVWGDDLHDGIVGAL